MCGIAGIIDHTGHINITEDLLRRMAESLKYRGPDQDGYYVGGTDSCRVGLAHKRLSIIDLSEKGRQPMYSADQSVVIVFNGEIYNYKTLKEKLVRQGYPFRTDSDTEVILVAYQNWGIRNTLEEMEGMFAFTIFDFKTQSTIIARDRFGEKPLYYYHQDNTLAFSSDIRSFDCLGINKTINNEALGYYLSEMCTPVNQSIWSEIKKLPPAHYITFDKSGLTIREYWHPDYRTKNDISIQEAIDHSENLLEKSIQLRLVADTPVGCFLSGGIDSSLVSLFAARNYSRRISTFSVGFEYESYNELPYARQVADKIGSDHHEIILNPNDLNITDALLREYGEPFADSSQIPTYYVSRFASTSVKVALGGDGGDEIFAGYSTYNQGFRMQKWHNNRYLLPLIRSASALTKHPKAKYLAGVMANDPQTIASALYRGMGFSADEIGKLVKDNATIQYVADRENKLAVEEALKYTNDVFDTVLYASLKTRLVNDYLVKTDRASMFTSLELRTPFLDRPLIDFVSSLPSSFLLHNNVNKYLTKKIAEKYFSKEFIYRPKMGFGIPIGEWMKKEWKKEVQEVLNYKNPYISMDQNYINQLFADHVSGKKDSTHRIWILYVLNKWAANNYTRS